MKKSNIILTGAMLLALAGAGGVGFGMYKDHQASKQREAAVTAIVREFKACPDDYRRRKTCMSEERMSKIRAEAGRAADEGRFEEAAEKYEQISDLERAREMAGKCDPPTLRRLRERIKLREDAINAMENERSRGR